MSSHRPSPREPPGPSFRQRIRRYWSELRSLVVRNQHHADRIAAVDHRISVCGTRGKSTLTRWLHDELVQRDVDTYAKITGANPLSLYNGLEWVIPREQGVKIYENERQIRRFYPMDAMVIENQGISPYTTRLVNSRYVDPTIVVITNVREDHLDTLGGDRKRIARALARSIPSGSRVICGEQEQELREYIARELYRWNSTVRYVDIPAEYAAVPGAELVFLLDEVLRSTHNHGLEESRAEQYIESLRVEWERLPGGRVFNAASVNDVQSTEAIRRSLLDDPEQRITPLVYLRRDRPGRTASFAKYLNTLADDDLIEKAHIVNGHTKAFDGKTTFPTTVHSPDDDPEAVLDELLSEGCPVLLMGNSTPEFMRELDDHIAMRAKEPMETTASGHETGGEGMIRSIEEGAQVLLLERGPGSASDELCVELLTDHDSEHSFMFGLEQTPHEQLERWYEYSSPDSPPSPDIISMTAEAPSTAAASGAAGSFSIGSDTTVMPVDDVTGLLQELRGHVAQPDEDRSATFCFGSISHLLEQRSVEDTFRILVTLTSTLTNSGITGHYHFATEGHDQVAVRTLAEIFDYVITVNEQGDLRVKKAGLTSTSS